VLETALSHQTAGRLDEAARGYREVLERAPNTHDALHMLGAIELGRQKLDDAERLMRAALALRPAYPAIEHNLQLVGDARIARMRAQPEQLAERALPILAELALAGPNRSSSRSTVERPGTSWLHLIGRVIGDDDDAWLLRRLCELLRPEGVSVWTTDADAPDAVAGARVKTIDGATGHCREAAFTSTSASISSARNGWAAREPIVSSHSRSGPHQRNISSNYGRLRTTGRAEWSSWCSRLR
jgi:hypothetical protein